MGECIANFDDFMGNFKVFAIHFLIICIAKIGYAIHFGGKLYSSK